MAFMVTEVHQEGRFYRLSTGRAEEDWQDPEQMEVPKTLELDLPFTIQTRQSDRTRLTKKYNPYGDDFVVDRRIVGSRRNNPVARHRHSKRPRRGVDR